MAYGIAYLQRKLDRVSQRVKIRYDYYEQKNTARDFGISTPDNPALRFYSAVLGWNSTAVDNMANRLAFREFANDIYDMGAIYAANNADILIPSAVLSALISSCSFIAIGKNEQGYPQMQVIDGGNATGILDPVTNMLTEGYAVLERNERGYPIRTAYYTAGKTEYADRRAGTVYTETHAAPFAALVPVIYRPDAKRPFGHSRISRACMNLTDSALRTLKRAEISAEFYSFPQKYVLGTSQDSDPLQKWSAAISALMEITKDEDGDKPTVGQFQQQSMAPHFDHIRTVASLFAGETGLTLEDLGFSTGNPQSADAIKNAHDNLNLSVRAAQKSFGIGLLNAGYIARCIADGKAYARSAIAEVVPKWEPAFAPDAASLASIGDGIQKINLAAEGYIGSDTIHDLTGIAPSNENG